MVATVGTVGLPVRHVRLLMIRSPALMRGKTKLIHRNTFNKPKSKFTMAETEFDRRGRHAEVAEVRDRRQPLPCKAEVVAEEVDPDWRYGPKLGAIPGWMKSVAAVAKRADREQEVSSCPSVRW